MPTGRRNVAVAVLNGKIHVIGGGNPAGTPRTDHYVYDPATNTWTTRASLPVATVQASAIGAGNSVYLIGGGNGQGTIYSANYVYDSVSNTWTKKASMPVARNLTGIALVGQNIYVIGGHAGGASTLTTTEVYNIASNTWSTKAAMPTARNAMMTEVVNGKIYVIGGTQTPAPEHDSLPMAVNEEFDPIANTWRKRAPMLKARYFGGAAVLNNRIHVIAGTTNIPATNSHEVYTPSLDSTP